MRACTRGNLSLQAKKLLSPLETSCPWGLYPKVQWWRTWRRRWAIVVSWGGPQETTLRSLVTILMRERRESSYPVVQRRSLRAAPGAWLALWQEVDEQTNHCWVCDLFGHWLCSRHRLIELAEASRAKHKFAVKRNSWPKTRGVAMNPVDHVRVPSTIEYATIILTLWV